MDAPFASQDCRISLELSCYPCRIISKPDVLYLRLVLFKVLYKFSISGNTSVDQPTGLNSGVNVDFFTSNNPHLGEAKLSDSINLNHTVSSTTSYVKNAGFASTFTAPQII